MKIREFKMVDITMTRERHLYEEKQDASFIGRV